MRALFALIVVGLLGTGCQIAGPDDPRTDNPESNERSVHQKMWDESNDGTYSYLLMRGCFCAYGGEMWVQVVDGEVTYAMNTWSNEPIPAEHLEYIETIDDIFVMIERAEQDADELDVDYSNDGYPSRVFIDWIKEAVDDEMNLEISNVVPGGQLID